MTTSIRAIIRVFVRPDHRLSCSRALWRGLLEELHRRGENRRESGAFLLGRCDGPRRRIEHIIYYDDLDPCCLDSGIVVFDGAKFGQLFEIARGLGLKVVADVHTHGGHPWQSEADRTHPAIKQAGHIALIVPLFACHVVSARELGVYEYEGDYQWCDRSGAAADRFFYIGWL